MLARTLAAGAVLLAATAALAQAPAQMPTEQQQPERGPDMAPGERDRGGEWSRRDERGGGRWNDRRGDRDRSSAGASEGLAACRADMADLCRGSAAGRDRLQCLVANRDRVSPACGEMLAAIEGREPRGSRRSDRREDGRDRREEGRGERRFGGGGERSNERPGLACRADAQALCGTVERGPARRQCLQANEAQLSPPCREALANAAARRREARRDEPGADQPR